MAAGWCCWTALSRVTGSRMGLVRVWLGGKRHEDRLEEHRKLAEAAGSVRDCLTTVRYRLLGISKPLRRSKWSIHLVLGFQCVDVRRHYVFVAGDQRPGYAFGNSQGPRR